MYRRTIQHAARACVCNARTLTRAYPLSRSFAWFMPRVPVVSARMYVHMCVCARVCVLSIRDSLLPVSQLTKDEGYDREMRADSQAATFHRSRYVEVDAGCIAAFRVRVCVYGRLAHTCRAQGAYYMKRGSITFFFARGRAMCVCVCTAVVTWRICNYARSIGNRSDPDKPVIITGEEEINFFFPPCRDEMRVCSVRRDSRINANLLALN